MPEEYYNAARKQAQKEYRAAVNDKQPPFLPALDTILLPNQMSAGQSLGIRQIPVAFLAGTKNSGRANMFARNFMPLAPEDSEFAGKWRHLCQVHLEEGIRDPLKIWEYMNRYYVEEGNKRASVLKFFGAVELTGEVYRILPERSNDPEVQRYYELLDFSACSGISYLEFSRPGCYEELQALMGKKPGEQWTEEEQSAFSSAYTNFRSVYEPKGGKELPVTTGDAFLAYGKVYGLQELRYGRARETAARLSGLWEDIRLLQYPDGVDLKLKREEERKPALLTRLVWGSSSKLRKVAFIHDRSPDQSGWICNHELGRSYVERVFQGKISTSAYYACGQIPPEQIIAQAVSEGNTLVLTTSPRLLSASLRAAVEHPEAAVLNCSLNIAHRYIRTYYARMYEVKYILGAMAGALAGGHNVGYICDYPIYGQIAGINAFALGVQLTNPKANVYLDWSGTGSVEAALERLTRQGIVLVSSSDVSGLSEQESSLRGLLLVTGDGPVPIARPVLKWGIYYEAIIRQILNRSYQQDYAGSARAWNYYWGMDAGVVGLTYNEDMLDGSRKLAGLLEKSICAGICRPFQDALYDQNGRRHQDWNGELLPEQIIRMDWLMENVVGAIPSYEDLTDTGKETVAVVGIAQAARSGSPVPAGKGIL